MRNKDLLTVGELAKEMGVTVRTLQYYDKEGLLKSSVKSEQGLVLAEKWWLFITDFTGGDLSLLPSLIKFNDNKSGWDEEMENKQAMIDDFVGQALELYFEKQKNVIPEMEV